MSEAGIPARRLSVSSLNHLRPVLQTILAQDGWTLTADFVAMKGRRRIAFFAHSPSPTKSLRAIARKDGKSFQSVTVVIAPTNAAMDRLRRVENASKFPRAFFASVEELRALAAGQVPVESGRLDSQSFNAEILANTAVGGKEISHYRLAFRAPAVGAIFPPQFVMMDTKPQRAPLGLRTVHRGQRVDAVDWTPQPLLKRPFGVCRLFFPGWPTDYLRRLELPATLALALYPPHPEHFDMLYKVLPDGIGTPLMTKLKRGQKVHMLGPLGRPYDVRRLRAEGVEEVHVIGGGVGTAPLIQLVESLRYYSFRVKVFVGIASVQSLRYRDELAATFGEKSRDAYIYVDDFLIAGVKPADVFVACDRELPKKVRGIPAENLFQGFVPEQYRRYLASRQNAGQTVAFTCGPNRMMEVMTDVCRQASVPLKVLLEKRMGCGIGVCFSCVQRVQRPDGADDYARVCMEGPVFDAKDILWNNNSKPNLEACCSPARC